MSSTSPPTVIKTTKSSAWGNGTHETLLERIENNIIFSIFVLLAVPILIYLVLAFFTQWSTLLNAYLLGKFKRPLPTHPELYYDVNCIDIMKAEDFAESNQLQRCRQLKPVDRPGPPVRR